MTKFASETKRSVLFSRWILTVAHTSRLVVINKNKYKKCKNS